MRQKGLSTFQKLSFCFLGITLLIVTILGVIQFISRRDFIIKSIESRLLYDEKSAINYFSVSYANNITKGLRIIEQSPTFNEYLQSPEQAIFIKPTVERMFLSFTKEIEGIVLSLRYIDRQGEEKVSIEGKRRIRQYTSLDNFPKDNVFYQETYSLFKELRKETPGTILFKGPFKYEDKYTFLVGITKTEPEVGGFGGVLIFHCDLSEYLTYLSNVKYDNVPIIWAYNREGDILLSPSQEKQKYLFSPSRDIRMGKNNDLLLKIEFNVPYSIIDAERITAIRISLLVSTIIIILATLISLMLARQFTKPIAKLVEGANLLSQGQLEERIQIKAKDEIGILGSAFNEMASKIQKSYEELEDRVKERTEELSIALEKLQASEEKYKALYNSSEDAIMLLTKEKGFVSGNPASIDMFRCKDEKEFTALSPVGLSPEYQPDGTLSEVKAQEMMMLAMQKGSHYFEWTHKRMDGEEFAATVLLSRVKLQDETILQATVRDITKYRNVREEVEKIKRELEVKKQSEEYLRTVLDSVYAGIVIIDPKEHKIVYSNDHAAKMIGLSKDEIIGHKCHGFMCPAEAGKCPITDLGQTVDHSERVLVKNDKTQMPVIKSVVPVRWLDKDYLVETFFNITELKETEDKLKENIKDLEDFKKITVARENKMIELKEQINKLCKELGKPAPHDLSFLD